MVRDAGAALVALNRFGYGARGGAAGDLLNAASDARGFVAADLARPAGALLELPGLLPTPALARILFDYQDEVRRQREANAKAAEAEPASKGMPPPPPPAPSAMLPAEGAPVPPQQPPNPVQRVYRAEALARFQRAASAEVGLLERLAAFWSNHFCISAGKGQPARIWAGAFEREAIRPHVLGRFADMLRAVEQHPAMLFFLDNARSIGPGSRAAQKGKRGLNENLAREILELHTLGVGGGYTQADVAALAAIITGWTYAGRQGVLGTPGTFVFNARAHQPGPQTLLGKTYPDTGLAQGEAALADIARHPSTARHVATKLVRHFVADEPPAALVAKVGDAFQRTDGDLRAVTLALISADEAWQPPLTKMRSPYDFLIAAQRLLARVPEDPGAILGGLALLGQPLWTPAGPNGFADTAVAWAAPEGMKLRLDIAAQLAARLGDRLNAVELLDTIAGEAASAETRQTVARAESRQQAVALLLMAPEFQRR